MKHVLVSLAVACLIFMTVELALRIAYPEQLKDVNYRGEVAYEFDEDYLVRLKKNVRSHFYRTSKNGGAKILWSTNSKGFRGGEITPAYGKRIVVYGDSNIQASFSEEHNTYPVRLQGFLSAIMPGVQVINAGVIGFGPDQALLRFNRDVAVLQPDIAIFNIFCDNDYGDLIRNRLFEIQADGQFVLTGFQRKPDYYLLHPPSREGRLQLLVGDFGRAFLERLIGRDREPGEMLSALREACAEEYEIYRQARPQEFSHFQDHYDIDLALYPDDSAAQEKVRLMEEIIKEIQKSGIRHGVRVIIQIQPSAIDLTRNNFVTFDDLSVFSKYERTRLTLIVERICVENRIEHLNLYGVFSQGDPAECYFLEDDHWNDRGQEVASRAMAALICGEL